MEWIQHCNSVVDIQPQCWMAIHENLIIEETFSRQFVYNRLYILREARLAQCSH